MSDTRSARSRLSDLTVATTKKIKKGLSMDIDANDLRLLVEELQDLHRRKLDIVSVHASSMTSGNNDEATRAVVTIHVAASAFGLIWSCYQQLSFGALSMESAENLLQYSGLPPQVMAQLMMVRGHNLAAFEASGINPIVNTQGIPECIRDLIIPKIKQLLDLAEQTQKK